VKVDHGAHALLCDREAEEEEMCRRSIISGRVGHIRLLMYRDAGSLVVAGEMST
jgi:hypothetical protein